MSLVLPLLCQLSVELEEEHDDCVIVTNQFWEKMAAEITRCFRLNQVNSTVQRLAAALDPRFRSLHFLTEEQCSAVSVQLKRQVSHLAVLSHSADDTTGTPSALKLGETDGSELPALKKRKSL